MKVRLFLLSLLVFCLVGCGFEEFPSVEPTTLQKVTQAQTAEPNHGGNFCDNKRKKKVQDACRKAIIRQFNIPIKAGELPSEAIFEPSTCQCMYKDMMIGAGAEDWY